MGQAQEPIKKTVGNSPIFGGNYGRVIMRVFRNTNRLNRQYYMTSFSIVQRGGAFRSVAVSASDLGNLKSALDAAMIFMRTAEVKDGKKQDDKKA